MAFFFTPRRLLSWYGLAWRLARPVLARHHRLARGFSERLVPEGWASPAQLWIQAASGGEAYLAWQLLRQLPPDAAESVLLTSCTVQGREVLGSAAAWCREHLPQLRVMVRFFPVDEPAIMQRALHQVNPKAVVLLETELWPGLMHACADAGVPYGIINGRMTPRSLARYFAIAEFLRAAPPAIALAMSGHDATRFAMLFGVERVGLMSNIKFDRVAQESSLKPNLLTGTVFLATASVAVLGSVREQEEDDVEYMLARLMDERPRTCIALVPRHLERVGSWSKRLKRMGARWALRSQTEEPVAPGTVVLWDRFGELEHLYALARGVFVGGSLRPLGGQNFLEPLAHGIVPVIGPYWDNFAWVGSAILEAGLVQQAEDCKVVTDRLLYLLQRPAPKARVSARFAEYVSARSGGTDIAAGAIANMLHQHGGHV